MDLFLTNFDAAIISISDSSALMLSIQISIVSLFIPNCFNLNLILDSDQPLFINALDLLSENNASFKIFCFSKLVII